LIPVDGGGNIRVSPLNVDYALYDETKRIVTSASVSSESGIVLIKAAKSDIDGNPIPLEVLELSGFTSYWNSKKSAGQSIQIVSQPGDEIHFAANIEIDGQKISATGESQTDIGVFPIIDAIKQYYKDLDFAGELTLLKLEDAIQSVDGVKNIKSTTFSAKPFGAGSYVDIFESTTNKYSSIAGYCIEDSANLLDATLNYIIS